MVELVYRKYTEEAANLRRKDDGVLLFFVRILHVELMLCHFQSLFVYSQRPANGRPAEDEGVFGRVQDGQILVVTLVFFDLGNFAWVRLFPLRKMLYFFLELHYNNYRIKDSLELILINKYS